MNFKNKRPRCSRAGCLCGGKYHKKVTGQDKLKYAAPPDYPVRHYARKDKRRWCRGKKGIHHEPRWVPNKGYESLISVVRPDSKYEQQIYECANCGKHLGWRTIHTVCGKQHYRWVNCEEGKAA